MTALRVLAEDDNSQRAFVKMKKGDKAQRLHKLFHDPAIQRVHPRWSDAVAQRIATWQPEIDR